MPMTLFFSWATKQGTFQWTPDVRTERWLTVSGDEAPLQQFIDEVGIKILPRKGAHRSRELSYQAQDGD